jgi:predicted RNase H-like HicB family nuclease
LPGCVTQGETRAELEANLREAVTGWLEAGESGVDQSSEILELAV